MSRNRRLGADCPVLDEWWRGEPTDRRLWLTDLREGLGSRPPPIVHPPIVPSRDAALLVAVHEDESSGLQVVLIERAADVGSHRGDIAFPGGAVEPNESQRDAAVREAWEEIGIAPAAVEVVAALSTHPILEGFVIWPFVGVLQRLPPPEYESREVQRALVVPLTSLLVAGAWWRQTWPADPKVILDYFSVPGNIAWGTTGALLRELLETCVSGRLARQRQETST
jgi:8-oxo-dGTP pyrophosphatase MutT (NUDIX family)